MLGTLVETVNNSEGLFIRLHDSPPEFQGDGGANGPADGVWYHKPLDAAQLIQSMSGRSGPGLLLVVESVIAAESLGSDTIDGLELHRYRADIDYPGLLDSMLEHLTADEDLHTGDTGAFEQARMTISALRDLAVTQGPIHEISVWIDDDGRVHQIENDTDITRYTDFGKPMNIPAVTASEALPFP